MTDYTDLVRRLSREHIPEWTEAADAIEELQAERDAAARAADFYASQRDELLAELGRQARKAMLRHADE